MFEPELPEWKKDAIANFHMATYMKIFVQFPTKFWNDTEVSPYSLASPPHRSLRPKEHDATAENLKVAVEATY